MLPGYLLFKESAKSTILGNRGKITLNSSLIAVRYPIIAYVEHNALFLMNIESANVVDKIQLSTDVDSIKSLEFCRTGNNIVVLGYDGKIYIYHGRNLVFDGVDCRKCVHMGEYFFLQTKRDLVKYHDVCVQGPKNTDKFVVGCDKLIVLTVDRTLSVYNLNLELIESKCFKEYKKLELLANDGLDVFLILATSHAMSKGYYQDKLVFIYNCGFFKVQCKSPFLDINMTANNFLLISGNQPSSAIMMNYSGNEIMRLPSSYRNVSYFDPQMSYVALAGFNNLDGLVEVYDLSSGSVCFSQKFLGASSVVWSPCGTYFGVCISRPFRGTNGIFIYDYHGRLVEEHKFEELHGFQWVGSDNVFKVLLCDEKFEKKISEVFVPSCIANGLQSRQVKARAQPDAGVNVKPKMPAPKPSRTELVLKLEQIEGIRTRIDAGGNASIDELNLLLQEDDINLELKQLSHN